MIGERWLSDVVFTTVQSKADISKVKKAATGDFQTKDLSKAVNTQQTNEITVRAWLSCAEGRKSTLVFCVDLAHLSALTAEFRRHGIDARSVTGDTTTVERSERLDAFRNGEYPVLLNCGVFTEGTDIPNIDCVLLARPTRSRNLLVQMIGRGMRLYPGKMNCHVIDMVASLEVGVVSTPTLFGLDPGALVKDADLDHMLQLREQALREQAKSQQKREDETRGELGSPQSPGNIGQEISFTHYDSVWDLISDTATERYIRSLSRLSWVRVDQDRYILSAQNGDYITIEKNPKETDMYHVVYTRKIPVALQGENSRAPYMRPREIAQGISLADVVRSADTFAEKKFPRNFILHAMPWRKLPASEGQLFFLNKFRDMDDRLTPEMVTKGKAADMITKIQFGARGRFKQIESTKKSTERRVARAANLQKMRDREKVEVGPIANADPIAVEAIRG